MSDGSVVADYLGIASVYSLEKDTYAWGKGKAGENGYGATFSERIQNPELWKKFGHDLLFGDGNPNRIQTGFQEGPISWITPGGAGEIKGIRALLSGWRNINWRSVSAAVKYHYARHVTELGLEKSIFEYTDDAINFFNSNQQFGKEIMLKDGSAGVKIRLEPNQFGGIFTQDGGFVSFWYY